MTVNNLGPSRSSLAVNDVGGGTHAVGTRRKAETGWSLRSLGSFLGLESEARSL